VSKIFVMTVPGFVACLPSFGPTASAADATRLLALSGVIALIIGVQAFWVAVPSAVEVLGTIVLVHFTHGRVFTNKGSEWECPALLTIALIALFQPGDGRAR
jgi:putative oxidoreductase